MSSFPAFEILIKGSIPEALQRVRDAARKEGLEFTGDTKSGKFEGSGVTGYYTVTANIVTIKITSAESAISGRSNSEAVEVKIKEFFK